MDKRTGEITFLEFRNLVTGGLLPHSRYEPSNIVIWKRLRDHRREIRELGFSGRLRNFYKIHTETKYARRPAWLFYAQSVKDMRKNPMRGKAVDIEVGRTLWWFYWLLQFGSLVIGLICS